MKFLTFTYKISKGFPSLFVRSIVLETCVGVMAACSLLIVSPLIDLLTKPGLVGASPLTREILDIFSFFGISFTLKGWLMVFFLFVALTSILQIFAWKTILETKYAVLKDLMIRAFEDFFQAQWYFFSSGKHGMLINTFTREIMVIGDAFSAMARFFVNLLQMIISLAVPLYISWQVTCISLGAAVVFVIPFIFVGKYNYRLGVAKTATANQFTSVIYENLSLAKILLGFGNQREGIRRLDEAFSTHQHVAIKSLTLGEAVLLLYRPLAVVVVCITLFVSQWFQVSLSEMTVLVFALFQTSLSVSKLMQEKTKLESFSPSYEQIEDLRRRARLLKQPTGAKKFVGFKKAIEIRGLSFSYPDRPRILNKVHLVIPKGKMIAVVGKSGAGKSTLVDILMAFHEPTSGGVTFDGVLLKEYDVQSYRSRLGYVPQDSTLFNMSIKDNLLWANPKASLKEMGEACRLAHADEFISHLPEGYDTLVGDRGVRLSGGQVQRMALARAVIRNPELLILDEATSSLDTHSERFIQQAIENISTKTTVVVVAHRLSTIKRADCIYVLENGEVVEKGAYADLVSATGRFNSMVKLQELGVTDEGVSGHHDLSDKVEIQ